MRIWDWLSRGLGRTKGMRSGRRTARSLREAYARYATANRKWLSAFRDLTIEIAPHFSAAARLRFSLQLAYLDRSDCRVEYLLDTSPERLATGGHLSELVASVDRGWSEADEAALTRQRPEYQELCAMIASVKAKAEENVAGFTEHLDAVSKTDRCLALLDAFRQEVARIEREASPR